jgi:hypothetical protein
MNEPFMVHAGEEAPQSLIPKLTEQTVRHYMSSVEIPRVRRSFKRIQQGRPNR